MRLTLPLLVSQLETENPPTEEVRQTSLPKMAFQTPSLSPPVTLRKGENRFVPLGKRDNRGSIFMLRGAPSSGMNGSPENALEFWKESDLTLPTKRARAAGVYFSQMTLTRPGLPAESQTANRTHDFPAASKGIEKRLLPNGGRSVAGMI